MAVAVAEAVAAGAAGPVHLPKVDTWQYRVINLANGLQAMLVHDSEADKAAASMDVAAGSMQDPEALPGLAHFTEHMLFYASEKYPEEDAYSVWVCDHGGYTNAWTAAENTNYQFSVNHDALATTLDRFAQFFVSPLISVDGIERERKAVDSEHSKNLNSDPWRQNQLWKALADQDHPYSRFFTGNMDTLGTRPAAAGVDVHAAVIAFHKQHYSSERMKLAVMGRESLDDLQALVESLFASVSVQVSEGVPPQAQGPYSSAQAGQLLKAAPVKEGHAICAKWVIPPQNALWREQPASLVSHLIGHEGGGSLFSLLRGKGWIKTLSAGDASPLRDSSLFSISMTLTAEGQAHVADVWRHVFQYIALLCAPGAVTHTLHDEVTALRRLAYDYRERPDPFSYTSSLASQLQLQPPAHVLHTMYHVPLDFSESAVRDLLAALGPESAMFLWTSHAFGDAVELTDEWYQQRYSVGTVPSEWVASWQAPGTDPALHLPTINPYIPKNLALVPENSTSDPHGHPVRLVNDPLCMLYHKTHLEFGGPKVTVRVRLSLPAAHGSLAALTATNLFVHLLDDSLAEVAYEAELAGLHYSLNSVSGQMRGLTLNVSGYSDKALVLLHTLLDALCTFRVRADRFAIGKERLRESLANCDRQQPYQWCFETSTTLMHTGTWSIDDRVAELPRITLESLQAHIDHTLFSVGKAEGIVLGNCDEAMTHDVATALRGLFTSRATRPVARSDMDSYRLVALPGGSETRYTMAGRNAADPNSAHLSTFHTGAQANDRAVVLSELTNAIVNRPAFHQLRTVEQIGYIVHVSPSLDCGVPMLTVLLQSTVLSAAEMSERVMVFLATWRATLETELTEEKFAADREELAKSRLEKPRGLQPLARKWHTEIVFATYRLDRDAQEVALLRALSRSDLLAYVDELLMSAKSVRRVSINVTGSAETGRNAAAAATPEPNGTCAAEASTTATDATCEAGTATAEAKTVASKGHAGGALTTLALPVTEVLDLKTFTLGSALWPAYRTAF